MVSVVLLERRAHRGGGGGGAVGRAGAAPWLHHRVTQSPSWHQPSPAVQAVLLASADGAVSSLLPQD